MPHVPKSAPRRMTLHLCGESATDLNTVIACLREAWPDSKVDQHSAVRECIQAYAEAIWQAQQDGGEPLNENGRESLREAAP